VGDGVGRGPGAEGVRREEHGPEKKSKNKNAAMDGDSWVINFLGSSKRS